MSLSPVGIQAWPGFSIAYVVIEPVLDQAKDLFTVFTQPVISTLEEDEAKRMSTAVQGRSHTQGLHGVDPPIGTPVQEKDGCALAESLRPPDRRSRS